jgi:hypothetical protein
MIGFPLARGAALVGVTKGATAGFQTLVKDLADAKSLAAVCDGSVNATSVTARGPRPSLRTLVEVDLGPLYGLMGVLRVLRCRSLGSVGRKSLSGFSGTSGNIRPAAAEVEKNPPVDFVSWDVFALRTLYRHLATAIDSEIRARLGVS